MIIYDVEQKNRETVRGAVCALSCDNTNTEPKPSHTNKIEYLAKKFGLTSAANDVLSELHNIGEICSLGNGYWLPAPARFVNLDNLNLIISASPTYILADYLKCEIYTTGIGRFCKKQDNNKLNYEQFYDWSNIPLNLINWTKSKVLAASRETKSLSIDESNCSIYCPWLIDEIRVGTPKLAFWRPLTQEIPDKVSFVLFKEKIGQTFRHGIVFFERGKIKSLYEGLSDASERARFMCGVDILHNVKKKFVLNKNEEQMLTVRLVRPLPKQEEKLFLTIAKKNNNIEYSEYSFLSFLYPIIEKTLLGLGYEKHTGI